VEEKGRHEQCTIFAIILKIARKYPALALRFLEKAEVDKAAQSYYLRELIKKVRGYSEQGKPGSIRAPTPDST
jgi:hypothetical protein